MTLSVILSTHNPDLGRLRRTLAALRAQTLPAKDWECVIVDNASVPALRRSDLLPDNPANFRLIQEPRPGLTHARRCGLRASDAEWAVLVDDDNVLATDYLKITRQLFESNPQIGVLGGISEPEFEQEPPPWIHEFLDLLACRNLGNQPILSQLQPNPANGEMDYPEGAPIGAGMGVRRSALRAWLEAKPEELTADRLGKKLSSGGDNEIVFAALKAGFTAAYFPEIRLTHLIPAFRCTPSYLARLNRGIQESWMQVLLKHQASPWPPIPRWTVPLRQLKAWFVCRAWAGPVEVIRWQGVCGHFEGRAA